MVSATNEARTPVGTPNEAVRTYIEEIVRVGYSDVLQRMPTSEEVADACEPRLLRLDGVTQLYLRLLCSSEFLSRFAFTMSPLLIARTLINQVAGQGPKSALDIEELAAKLISAGWCPFIQGLLQEARVRDHLLGEMRGIAARTGLSAPDAGETVAKPVPARAPAAPNPGERMSAGRSRTRTREVASQVPSASA